MKKEKIFIILILLISLLVAIGPVSAQPSEVWVDIDGTVDSTHFISVQDGINAVEPGGKVHVAAGTYVVSATITIEDKDISLIGEDESITILDGGTTYKEDGSVDAKGCRVIETARLSDSTVVSGFTIRNGFVIGDGCGMYNHDHSSPTVTNCTFTDNTAYYDGGGMYNYYSSDPTVTNCTFTNNTAYFNGGGMYNHDHSSPTVTNCTFTNNTAHGYGGGMCNYYLSSPTVTNCILWNDAASFGAEIINLSDSTPSVTYSDIQGGYPTGEGNIDSDPLFSNAAAGDFSLMSGSPCIDSGTDTGGKDYGYVTDDIIGTSRPQGGVYDMGAYECVPPSWSPISLQPLVTTSLAQANSLWACIEPDLAKCSDKETLAMASRVQEHMRWQRRLQIP